MLLLGLKMMPKLDDTGIHLVGNLAIAGHRRLNERVMPQDINYKIIYPILFPCNNFTIPVIILSARAVLLNVVNCKGN
ncbi:unannotated protein [freshwater metagenome]|uniref:Unannotated protein n=1 Tax=freshwater metagenome TaxID=449393 RepID=A0A6J7CG47_9ZZZZ